MNPSSSFDFGHPSEPLKLWQWWVFGVLLVCALLLRVYLYGGCQGSDDLTTWSLAATLSQGKVIPNVVTNYVTSVRYGPAFAIAVFLRLFGNTEWVALIYPVAMSLAGIAAVFAVARWLGAGFWVSLTAAGCLAVNAIDISCATTLYPDGPACVFAFLGLFGVLFRIAGLGRSENPPLVRRIDLASLACGLALYWAFMHKETALVCVFLLLLLPAVIWVRADRELRKSIVRMVGSALLGVAILALAEHLFHRIVFHEFLHRWKVVMSGYDHWFTLFKKSGETLNKNEVLLRACTEMRARFPGGTVAILAAFGTAVFQVITGRGRNLRSLLGIAFLVLICSWAKEAATVYQFEPRRYLQLVYLSFPVLAGAIGRINVTRASSLCAYSTKVRSTGWKPVSLGLSLEICGCAALLTAAAWCGWTREYALNRGQQVRLSYDRKINRWLHEPGRAPVRPVYIDEFTFLAVQGLSGFQDLTGLGVTLLREARRSRYGALVDTELRPNSWVVYNPRTNEIFRRFYPKDQRFASDLVVPRASWKVSRVLPHANERGQCAIVFEVGDGANTAGATGDSGAKLPVHGWHLVGGGGAAPVSTATEESPEVVVNSGEVRKLAFEAPASELRVGALKSAKEAIFFSLRVNRPEVAHDGLVKVPAGFEVSVRSAAGRWYSLGNEKRLLCYDSDPILGAFVSGLPPETVRLEVTFDQPGRYRLMTPRIDLLPESVTQPPAPRKR